MSTSETSSSPRRSWPQRFVSAARLDASVYDEIEHDPTALKQATAVVVLGGLARGVGAWGAEGWAGLVGSVLSALILWFATAAVVNGIGVRRMGLTSSFEELLRTLGFAAAPLVALVFVGLLPEPLDLVLLLAAHGLAALALALAIRQALDTTTARALAVCAAALGVSIGLLIVLGLLFFSRAAS